jgi:hypothetical protein
MSDTEMQLHPIAAKVSAALGTGADGRMVVLPPEAARVATDELLRLQDAQEAVEHLCALVFKIKRIAGDAGLPAMVTIAGILQAKVTSASALAEQLKKGGLDAATAAVVGREVVSRAPTAPQVKAPTVKARRGLSK